MTEEKNIRLTDEEIATALGLERTVAMGKARLEAQIEAVRAFQDHLHRVYKLPIETYRIIDWMVGFQPKPPEGDTHG